MKARWSWVRRANVVLAMAALAILVWQGPRIYREARFRLTGTTTVDGLTIYLDPADRAMTPWTIASGEWEAGETAEFRRLVRPGDTVIDVGANVGWYTLLASRRAGPSGRVIAFEPAPSALAFLRRNVAVNRLANVTIEPKALSDRRGTLTLHLDDVNRGHHSVVDTTNSGGDVVVEAVTLDEYLAGRSGEIALVKIDVEGAEGLILAGMQDILRNRPPRALIVEFNPGAIRRTGLEPEAVLADLADAGYRAREIDVLTGESAPLDRPTAHAMADRLESRGEWTNLVFERDGR